MSRNAQARSGLPQRRTEQPQLGARNPVIYDEHIEDFFIKAGLELDDIIHPAHTRPAGSDSYRRGYKLYDDPDRLGITIVERRLSKDYANRNRIRWTRNDVGRIRGSIEDEVGRLELPQPWPITVKFTDVIKVGDADDDRSRKLALVVDQATKESELLVNEHEIVMNGLGRELVGLRYPYDDFIPKFTVGGMDKRRVRSEQINEAVEALKTLLPLSAEIEEILFTSHQEF